MYVISYFSVASNKCQFRATHYEYKIYFQFSTYIHGVADEYMIPICKFSFVIFGDIIDKKVDNKYFVGLLIFPLFVLTFSYYFLPNILQSLHANVIGRLLAINDFESSNNNRRVIVHLKDIEY